MRNRFRSKRQDLHTTLFAMFLHVLHIEIGEIAVAAIAITLAVLISIRANKVDVLEGQKSDKAEA